MNNHYQEFIAQLRNPVKFRLFLLRNLPSAYFAGVRIRNFNEELCEVTVPYKWFSRNPFRSTYFACLSMAAEMSTGAIALAHLYKRKPRVSVLVVKIEGEFLKKATGTTRFICRDSELIRQTIEESVATGDSRVITARSTGRNDAGELVADFGVTWSFKPRTA